MRFLLITSFFSLLISTKNSHFISKKVCSVSTNNLTNKQFKNHRDFHHLACNNKLFMRKFNMLFISRFSSCSTRAFHSQQQHKREEGSRSNLKIHHYLDELVWGEDCENAQQKINQNNKYREREEKLEVRRWKCGFESTFTGEKIIKNEILRSFEELKLEIYEKGAGSTRHRRKDAKWRNLGFFSQVKVLK